MKRDKGPISGYTSCETALGWVGIAWSSKGLAALTLPEPTETASIRRLPPGGDRNESAPGLDISALKEALLRAYRGEAVLFGEALDPGIGTPFQRQVWAITRAIPRGQTRTYGEIAREAGSPGAARAVGQAMARNPWPMLVPCHRVVGHDGRLTGFGGGLAMKQQLLEMERTVP
jgi:methylated-DNA-[protein]-cysteine S-methyltransferase